jgi:hypothetical protein
MVYLALKIDADLNQLLLLGTSYIFVMGQIIEPPIGGMT